MILSTTPPPKPLSEYSEKVREALSRLYDAEQRLVAAFRTIGRPSHLLQRDAAFAALAAALAEERSDSGEPGQWLCKKMCPRAIYPCSDCVWGRVPQPVIAATEDHPAIYKDGSRLTATPPVLPPVALPVTAPEVTEALWDLELIANSLLQQGRRVHPRAIRQHIETIRAAITLSPRAAAPDAATSPVTPEEIVERCAQLCERRAEGMLTRANKQAAGNPDAAAEKRRVAEWVRGCADSIRHAMLGPAYATQLVQSHESVKQEHIAAALAHVGDLVINGGRVRHRPVFATLCSVLGVEPSAPTAAPPGETRTLPVVAREAVLENGSVRHSCVNPDGSVWLNHFGKRSVAELAAKEHGGGVEAVSFYFVRADAIAIADTLSPRAVLVTPPLPLSEDRHRE